MNRLDQITTLAEACGWSDIESVLIFFDGNKLMGNTPYGDREEVPDYFEDYNAIQDAKIAIVKDLKTRVNWINNLRDIVSRRMPTNKVGSPITNDIDLHFATCEEHVEALIKTVGKWKK